MYRWIARLRLVTIISGAVMTLKKHKVFYTPASERLITSFATRNAVKRPCTKSSKQSRACSKRSQIQSNMYSRGYHKT